VFSQAALPSHNASPIILLTHTVSHSQNMLPLLISKPVFNPKTISTFKNSQYSQI